MAMDEKDARTNVISYISVTAVYIQPTTFAHLTICLERANWMAFRRPYWPMLKRPAKRR